MDIDMSALRGLVREKDISLDVVVDAIEAALLVAYHHTEGAQQRARVVLDRSTGHVTVFAEQVDESGDVLREWDDTPEGFGRIAATTAKQVIVQRLRDAEDERTFGEYSGREGDVVSGVIQQGRDPREVMIDLGDIEAGRGLRARRAHSLLRRPGAQDATRSACDGVAHTSQPRAAPFRARGP